jgi:flagellar hook assembly protein FlgD
MASFDLRDVFPNPFSGDTTIRYDVARPQLLRISVYDVTGRRVRSLHDAIVSAGRSAVSWDGRDSDGQPVAAGVYFLRLQAEDVSQTRKVVRLDR